jgi:hypothetical protein
LFRVQEIKWCTHKGSNLGPLPCEGMVRNNIKCLGVYAIPQGQHNANRLREFKTGLIRLLVKSSAKRVVEQC